MPVLNLVLRSSPRGKHFRHNDSCFTYGKQQQPAPDLNAFTLLQFPWRDTVVINNLLFIKKKNPVFADIKRYSVFM